MARGRRSGGQRAGGDDGSGDPGERATDAGKEQGGGEGLRPGASAARPSPVTAMTMPRRMMASSRNRPAIEATVSVPIRYAATFAVPSEPATVLDSPRSSRMAGRSTP